MNCKKCLRKNNVLYSHMYCILYWGGVMVNLLSLYLFTHADVQHDFRVK
jgi:hypothetical protein